MTTKDLDQEITTLNGAKIMLTADKALTYQSALVSACETYQGESGTGDTLRAYNLGMKIIDAKGELKFDKEEVDFLKKIVENNRIFMAVVVGRLIDFIKKFN